jgi:protein TonB
MKRKKNLLSLMLCISVALHGAIFFLSPGYPLNNRLPNPIQSPDPFALVNLALIEPAAPKLPSPPAAAPSPPPPEALPGDIAEGPAETLIPVEDFIPVNLDLSPPAETSAAGSAAEAASSGGANADAAGKAIAIAYVKRNYNYIMSSIQKNLRYPSQARRAGAQGTAEISFTIHENGTVSDVTVNKSSGSEILDTAAVDAIYAAVPFRSPPAEARLAIPVTFRLR